MHKSQGPSKSFRKQLANDAVWKAQAVKLQVEHERREFQEQKSNRFKFRAEGIALEWTSKDLVERRLGTFSEAVNLLRSCRSQDEREIIADAFATAATLLEGDKNYFFRLLAARIRKNDEVGLRRIY